MRLLYFLFGLLAVTHCESASQIFLNMTQIPGFIQFDNAGDNLFYWLFPSQNDPANSPFVVWLTGGPGCSSELAIFYENGPFKINDDLSLKLNPYSWNMHANMLYVDQPVGTGYSYGPNYVDNEDQVASDFYKFIVKFFDKYPSYTANRPFFIVGESYAGHYVPAISAYIKQQNNPKIQLVASAIGNGLVDPYLQYPAYPVFSLKNNLISQSEYNELVSDFNYCQNLIGDGSSYAFYYCNEIVDEITGDPPNFNVYNVKEPCSYPPLCYNFDNLAKFLNRSDVITALGVQNQSSQWSSCNSNVYQHLEDDWMNNLAPKVQYLLQNGVRVLVYSGTLDFICNWMGGEMWTNGFNWTYTSQFQSASYTNWTCCGSTPSGQYKKYDKLTFMKVYNAGHMVPMDQPAAALALLTQFFKGFTDEYEIENNIKFYGQ